MNKAIWVSFLNLNKSVSKRLKVGALHQIIFGFWNWVNILSMCN